MPSCHSLSTSNWICFLRGGWELLPRAFDAFGACPWTLGQVLGSCYFTSEQLPTGGERAALIIVPETQGQVFSQALLHQPESWRAPLYHGSVEVFDYT
ncbi:hypothetical protein BS78_05G122300 [Paspalum vaginatum]|nr:hypothetical protein BS78_05G122300 [Paspalum vaginatum]